MKTWKHQPYRFKKLIVKYWKPLTELQETLWTGLYWFVWSLRVWMYALVFCWWMSSCCGALWEQQGPYTINVIIILLLLWLYEKFNIVSVHGGGGPAWFRNACWLYFERVTGSCSMNHWIKKSFDNQSLSSVSQSQSANQTTAALSNQTQLTVWFER